MRSTVSISFSFQNFHLFSSSQHKGSFSLSSISSITISLIIDKSHKPHKS